MNPPEPIRAGLLDDLDALQQSAYDAASLIVDHDAGSAKFLAECGWRLELLHRGITLLRPYLDAETTLQGALKVAPRDVARRAARALYDGEWIDRSALLPRGD